MDCKVNWNIRLCRQNPLHGMLKLVLIVIFRSRGKTLATAWGKNQQKSRKKKKRKIESQGEQSVFHAYLFSPQWKTVACVSCLHKIDRYIAQGRNVSIFLGIGNASVYKAGRQRSPRIIQSWAFIFDEQQALFLKILFCASFFTLPAAGSIARIFQPIDPLDAGFCLLSYPYLLSSRSFFEDLQRKERRSQFRSNDNSRDEDASKREQLPFRVINFFVIRS